MAFEALVRELSFHVVVGFLIVLLMARPAVGGSAAELAVVVARCAIDADVRSGKREVAQIVVKLCGSPGDGRMTDRASVIVFSGDVVRILRVLVVRLVTGPTIGGEIAVISVGMTLRTIHLHMRASQRKISISMIERGGLPTHRVVAFQASMRELILHVIGLVGLLIIRLMTRPAIRRCAGILAIRVTRCAIHADVSAG